MAQLIDTTVFITLERRGLALGALAGAIPDEPLALASITAAELLAGVYRADSPGRRARRAAFVEAILEAIPTVPFDLRAARVYASLWAELAAAGRPIGAHDLLVAATALAHGYAVVTENPRHFHVVPGLSVRTPRW